MSSASDRGEAAAIAAFMASLNQHRARLQAILDETPGRDNSTWPVVRQLLAEFQHAKQLAMMLQPDTGGWFFYTTGPIDHWDGWHSLDAIRDRDPDDWEIIPLIAQEFARDGWEGDGHWYLTALPDPASFGSGLVIAVKQSNNGQVFLASTLALPWLADEVVEPPRLVRFSIEPPSPF